MIYMSKEFMCMKSRKMATRFYLHIGNGLVSSG